MKMKTYSIGRDLNCDIVINDSTDVISRRHALLNIAPSGKMTIIDQSSNGTYVNGIRITQNVAVPVTRKDIVSLAHVAKLDWSQVPRFNQWIKYSIGGVAVVVVILGFVFGTEHLRTYLKNSDGNNLSAIEKVDSTAIKKIETARLDSLKNVARQDSLKNVARQDSIKNVARQDSIKKALEKARQNSINAVKKENKSEENKDKDKSAQTKKRAIG